MHLLICYLPGFGVGLVVGAGVMVLAFRLVLRDHLKVSADGA